MNNAFYAQELSDEQLEMVVGAGSKSKGGHNVTVSVSSTSSNKAKQSQNNTVKNSLLFDSSVGGFQDLSQGNFTDQYTTVLVF